MQEVTSDEILELAREEPTESGEADETSEITEICELSEFVSDFNEPQPVSYTASW